MRPAGVLQVHTERPRELRWYHAAAMLFGDWGTSRLYVLGIAFVASGHASFWYVAAMCGLVSLVGFAYTIICAHYPDGGGVYSAAKQRSRLLAVIGTMLLIANYIVTAALSAFTCFRYMLPAYVSPQASLYLAMVALVGMGVLNTFGLKRVGTWALVIALFSAAFYIVIGLACTGTLGHAEIHAPHQSAGKQWSLFVNVILALSGVEAIANMTGVMAEPVARNARRAILTVLAEVVILNLIMAYAMSALPELRGMEVSKANQYAKPDGTPLEAGVLVDAAGSEVAVEQRQNLNDHMIKIIATERVGYWFAGVSSIFFGLLLLSAANTAIGGMISVQYLLARDKELPSNFTYLNRFGVPWVGLAVATAVPVLVLLAVRIFNDPEKGNVTEILAGLYAIGVVGAIAINLVTTGTNFELTLKRWERAVLLGVGALIVGIEMTIAWEKPYALLFAGIVIGSGLLARTAARRVRVPVPVPALAPVPEPAAAPEKVVVPAGMARLLVPTRGGAKLLKFAVNSAKEKNAAVYLLFVREIALAFRERGGAVGTDRMTAETDKDAREIFKQARELGEKAGVPVVCLYAVHDSPAEVILDHAAMLGVDAVIMGVSRRGALWRTMKGDVLREVVEFLPESIPLLIFA